MKTFEMPEIEVVEFLVENKIMMFDEELSGDPTY